MGIPQPGVILSPGGRKTVLVVMTDGGAAGTRGWGPGRLLSPYDVQGSQSPQHGPIRPQVSTRSQRRTPALEGRKGVCANATIDSWSPGFECVPRPVVFGERPLGGGGWDGDGVRKPRQGSGNQ